MKQPKVKAVEYMGYLQGWKVYIDGVKYPRTHGHWYTHPDSKLAVKHAELERELTSGSNN